jgi:hypothetical protein
VTARESTWVGTVALLVTALAAPACERRSPAPAVPPVAPAVAVAVEVGWRRGICGADGWCWGYPRPQGARLNRLWGTAPTDLWAVGEGGTIIGFDGKTWSRAPSGTTDTLVALAGRARGDAWAIGRERTLLRLREGVWSPWRQPPDAGRAPRWPAAGEFRDIVALPNGEAWVVGGVERGATLDGGDELAGSCLMGRFSAEAWLFDEDDACTALVQVWGSSPDDVWARGGADVVHWNGKSLTKNPSGRPAPLVGRHGIADGWRLQIDWGSGTAGTMLHATLAARADQAPRARDFWAFGAADVWTLGTDGALAHFDGKRWEQGDLPVKIKGVAGLASDDVWAVASPSTLLHHDGRRWQASPIPGNANVDPSAIGVAAPHDIWVLAGARILRFDRERWTEVPAAAAADPRTSSAAWSALMIRAPDDVWIGGDGQALHWNGRQLEVIDTDFPVTALWGDAHDIWAGSPVHRWNGSTFVVPPEVGGSEAGSAGFWAGAAGPGAIWLARGGTIARLAAGRLETVGTLPVSLRAIWQAASGDVWAVGSHIVHGTADAAGAMTWTVEDSVGLTGMTDVGGTRDLIWARGAQGILFRRDNPTQ